MGGIGTRLREHTEFKPKPLVTVGGIPMIWHIMKIYSSFGHKNFVLCLGYKGWMIKDFFLNYRWKRNDFTLDLGKSGAIEHYERSLEDWKITFADTGKKTNTAGRILISRKYLDEKRFMMTYGDGVSDINFDKLRTAFSSAAKSFSEKELKDKDIDEILEDRFFAWNGTTVNYYEVTDKIPSRHQK